MRIDQDRLAQLVRRAGKARQHRHPRIVRRLRGEIFLDHQVHAVAQRRHQGDPRRPVKPGQNAVVEALIEVAQRRPVEFGIAPVDVSGGGFEGLADLAVFLNVGARRRRDLQQHGVPAGLRIIFQEMRIGGKPRRQPLRVIEPVDADDQRAFVDAVEQPAGVARFCRRCRLGGDRLDVDPDREHRGAQDPAEAADEAAAEILAVVPAHEVVAKSLQVGLGLKADDVIGAQRRDKLLVIGQDPHQLGGRERGVQKEPERLTATLPAQRLAERDQMVIVHPDQIARGQHRQQGARERVVDPQVPGQSPARELDQRRPVVKQRPQHPVGVADVILLEIPGRQIERGENNVAGGRHGGCVARPLADRPAEPEPDAAGALQRGAQRHRQPTLGDLRRIDCPDPVGNDDQAAIGRGVGTGDNPGDGNSARCRRRCRLAPHLPNLRIDLACRHPLASPATQD